MIDVCLLGTGGTMPLPDRALTSLLIRFNGSSFLVDCGEGTQVQLRRAGLSMHDIDVILITHFHADHVTGLPGLLLSMAKSERTEPVTIIAPKGASRVIACLCVTAPVMPFEINIFELDAQSHAFDIKGLKIFARLLDHSVTCFGYSFELARSGKFHPDKARELGIAVENWKRLQRGESVDTDGRTITPDMVMGEPRKGIKLAYCTDTRPTGSMEQLARGCDLFICEGMYAEDNKLKKAREKKHMLFSEAQKAPMCSGFGLRISARRSMIRINTKRMRGGFLRTRLSPMILKGSNSILRNIKALPKAISEVLCNFLSQAAC